MSDELLPCPFCGGDAEVMIESSYYMGGCKNEQCGAGGLLHVDRAAAVAAWNRRDQERTAAAWPSGEQAAEELAEVLSTEFDYYRWAETGETHRNIWRKIAAAVLARLNEQPAPDAEGES